MHDRCMEVLIKVMVGGGCCKVLKVCLPSLNDLCTIVYVVWLRISWLVVVVVAPFA